MRTATTALRGVLSRVVALSFAAVSAAAPVATAQEAQGREVWKTSLTEEVKRLVLSSIGHAVVEYKAAGIAAFEPATGKTVWERTDASEFLELVGTPFAVVKTPEGREVMELAAGTTVWRFARLPVADPRSYVSLGARGMVLLYGQSPQGSTTLLAATLDSGKVLWQQDHLFGGITDPKKALVGSKAPPLLDTDSTVILDADEAGVFRLRLSDGAKIWSVSDSILNLDRLMTGFQAIGGMLLAAHGKKLMALDLATGAVRWSRDDKFPGPVYQFAATPSGLLVGGWTIAGGQKRARVPQKKSWIQLLDLATGEAKWAEPQKLTGGSPFHVRSDTVFSPRNKGWLVVSLGTGASLLDIELEDFGGKEEASSVEALPDGDFLLSSSQNMMRLSPSGTLRYHRFLKAPGASFLAKFATLAFAVAAGAASYSAAPPGGVYFVPTGPAAAAFAARYSATTRANQYQYIYTSETDDDAGGFDLTRVAREDGRVLGRIRMLDRSPTFVLDPVSGVVVVAHGTELTGYRY